MFAGSSSATYYSGGAGWVGSCDTGAHAPRARPRPPSREPATATRDSRGSSANEAALPPPSTRAGTYTSAIVGYYTTPWVYCTPQTAGTRAARNAQVCTTSTATFPIYGAVKVYNSKARPLAPASPAPRAWAGTLERALAPRPQASNWYVGTTSSSQVSIGWGPIPGIQLIQGFVKIQSYQVFINNPDNSISLGSNSIISAGGACPVTHAADAMLALGRMAK